MQKILHDIDPCLFPHIFMVIPLFMMRFKAGFLSECPIELEFLKITFWQCIMYFYGNIVKIQI